MSHDPTPDDLEALIRLFDQSDWTSLRLKTGGMDLVLSKDAKAALDYGQAPAHAAGPAAPPAASHPLAATPAGATDAPPPGWIVVRAASLGTFYRAPKAGSPPFVEMGQAVTAGQEVCVIEVMKLFTSVHAGACGVVRQIYAQDGQLVEFDQPLFLIEPDA